MKISCLMVTQEPRWAFFERACQHFLRQTWADKELVVAAYGEEAYLARLREHCERLALPTRFALTTRPTSLGALRNLSVQAATGELICQWDDDDLHHPRRVELQAKTLLEQRADFCLLSDYWHYFADSGRLYWVDCRRDAAGNYWPRSHLQTLPGTLLARRAAMLPYTPNGRGEDGLLLVYATIRQRKFALVHGAGWCYVYVFHGANTWNRAHHESLLRRRGALFTAAEVRSLVCENQARDPDFTLQRAMAAHGFPEEKADALFALQEAA